MRVLFFLCVVLLACSGDDAVPDGVLPQDKMSGVMYDVIRADEMVDFMQISDSSFRNFSKRTALYDTIFSLHGVKKEEFRSSLKFYQKRPDLLREVIGKMQQKFNDTSAAKKREVNP